MELSKCSLRKRSANFRLCRWLAIFIKFRFLLFRFYSFESVHLHSKNMKFPPKMVNFLIYRSTFIRKIKWKIYKLRQSFWKKIKYLNEADNPKTKTSKFCLRVITQLEIFRDKPHKYILEKIRCLFYILLK